MAIMEIAAKSRHWQLSRSVGDPKKKTRMTNGGNKEKCLEQRFHDMSGDVFETQTIAIQTTYASRVKSAVKSAVLNY